MTRTFITLAASLLLAGAAFAAEADGAQSKGEFIQQKLDEGLRGDALAEAIMAEWQARKGAPLTEKAEERVQKLAAKATAKHQGKPESTPRR